MSKFTGARQDFSAGSFSVAGPERWAEQVSIISLVLPPRKTGAVLLLLQRGNTAMGNYALRGDICLPIVTPRQQSAPACKTGEPQQQRMERTIQPRFPQVASQWLREKKTQRHSDSGLSTEGLKDTHTHTHSGHASNSQ